MAKFQFEGLDEYVAQLQKLYGDIDGTIKMAVYDGAAVVADAVRKEIEALPVTRETSTGLSLDPAEGISQTQKEGLLKGLGITNMQNDRGVINVKIGMEGYNGAKTRKYPNGQPNAMIARSIISGTSQNWYKNNFQARAARAAKKAAEDAMRARVEENIQNIMNEQE